MSLPGKKRELPVVRWSYPLLYFPAKGNLAMKCSVKSAPKVKEEKWGRGDLKYCHFNFKVVSFLLKEIKSQTLWPG